jgi:hypothetical protein
MRRVNEEVMCRRKIAEINRLKQIKKIKYSWLGHLAVYNQLVEVTLYLTRFFLPIWRDCKLVC